ncbi:integrase core domain [Labeo rohita]|uniref:Gypsy retrotransposon integrase-like protein 1 n=1 Tax=Labeo rohita TaxID=84645 RepID=A0A498MLV7_LABRO|nr:integrase core domain [Labeo rohita]
MSGEAYRKRLLSEKDLTFKQACEIALGLELAYKDTKELTERADHSSAGVHGVASYSRGKQKDKQQRGSSYSSFTASSRSAQSSLARRKVTCHRCGREGHQPQECHFRTAVCHACGKTGHLKKVCKSSKRAGKAQLVTATTEESSASEDAFDLFTVYTAQGQKDGLFLQLDLSGNTVTMQIDTGASVSLIPESVYKELLSDCPLQPVEIHLSSYTGDIIPVLGEIQVPVQYNGNEWTLPLMVVKGDKTPLMGRNWLQKIKLDWGKIFSLKQETAIQLSLKAVLDNHKDLFKEGYGKITDFQSRIRVKRDSKPIFHKPRPVPYALREAVEKELERLQRHGIITQVERSDWAAPIVVVPKKDGSVRVCGDYKVTINRCILPEEYPLPNTEDLFATLAGDALSRLPCKHGPSEEEHEGVFLISHVEELPVSAKDIAEETRRDPILSKVLDLTLTGWPKFVPNPNLKPFYERKDQLSTDQGCVLWGSRVVIPPKYRRRLLSDLHEGHPGVTRMKALARSFLWWPGLDQEIQAFVSQCLSCETTLNRPPTAPLHPWSWATAPWERIHVDYAEINKQHFLVVIDVHSKWIEVLPTKLMTAEKTANLLRNLFASYGLPKVLVSDNGPQFTAPEFEQFLTGNGLRHVLSPPYHPASNGAAERAVQTFKKAWTRMQSQTVSPSQRLARFLFTYRNTPHTVTERTPAELFLKRQPRTRLSLLKPDVSDVVSKHQLQQQKVHDKKSKSLRAFSLGERVLVRDFRHPKKLWIPGLQDSKVKGSVMTSLMICQFRELEHLIQKFNLINLLKHTLNGVIPKGKERHHKDLIFSCFY